MASDLNFAPLLLDPLQQEILEDIKEMEEEIALETGTRLGGIQGQQPSTPTILNGHLLPIPVRGQIRNNLTGLPLREICPEYKKDDTFVVIGRGSRILYRFGDATAYIKANGGWRNQAIGILTHGVFNYFMVFAILLNLVIYAAIPFEHVKPPPPPSTAIDSAPAPPPPPGSEDGLNYGLAIKISNLAFVSLFILEFTLKVLARGLFKAKNPFSTLQISWSWLDLFVIVVGILSILNPVNRTLAALNAFRALKLIPLIPSWLGGYDLLFKKTWRRLFHAMLFIVVIYYLLGNISSDLYYSSLRNKCVLNTTATQIFESGGNFTDEMFLKKPNSSQYLECSNSSMSPKCPEDHVCVKAGKNPMGGNVGFDNLGVAELTLLNLVFQDFPEYVYEKIWLIHGSPHIIFAIFIFFLSTVPIGTLIYSILGYEFLEGFSKLKSELDKKYHEKTNVWSHRFDVTPSNGWEKFREHGRKIVTDKNFDLVITFFILLDILTFTMDGTHLDESPVLADFLHYLIRIIHFVYVAECILKVVFIGIKPYWKSCWNRFDFFVAILIPFYYTFQHVFANFIIITILKIVPRWPKLNLFFNIMGTGIWSRWMFGINFIFLFLFSYIGYVAFGESYKANETAFPPSEFPRWNMIDFWHSYRLQFRAFCGEWIETLWDLLLVSPGFSSILFMVFSGTIGNFLVTCLGLCIVLTTYNHLNTAETESKPKMTSLERIFWPITLLCRNIESKITGVSTGKDSDDDEDREDEKDDKEKQNAEDDKDAEKVVNGKEEEVVIVPTEVEESHPNLPEKIMAHFAYKMFVCLLIIGLSILVEFEQLGAEITFICYFALEIIGRAALLGFGRKILSLGLLFDTLQVVNSVLSLTLERPYGLWYFGTFRILMIVSRVTGLRLVRNQLWKQIRILWQYFLATLFVWFVFALVGLTMFAANFWKCSDGGDVVEYSLVKNKSDCLERNLSWVSNPETFDSVGSGLWALYIVASRNGWINIITAAEDRTGYNGQPDRDSHPYAMIYFMIFLIYGVLFPFSIMVGVLFHDFKRESWIKIFEQGWPGKSKPERERKNETSNNVLDKYIKSQYFELWVCLTILVDSILYTLMLCELNESSMTAVEILRHVILLFYIVELVLRAVTYKKEFLKHWLNYLLILVILLSLIEIGMVELARYAVAAGLPRSLRLFHLLALDGIGAYKIVEFGSFRRALAKSFPVLSCISVFYGLLYATFSLFGATVFGKVEDFRGLHSTTTLFKVATISGMEGVYYKIAKPSADCSNEKEDTYCGYPHLGKFYVVGFLAITVFCFVNFYLALILETIEQLGKPEEKDEGQDGKATNLNEGAKLGGEGQENDAKA